LTDQGRGDKQQGEERLEEVAHGPGSERGGRFRRRESKHRAKPINPIAANSIKTA
jgi:hypothetical protein